MTLIVEELDLDVDVTFFINLIFDIVETGIIVDDFAFNFSDYVFAIWIIVVWSSSWNELIDTNFKIVSTRGSIFSKIISCNDNELNWFARLYFWKETWSEGK